MVQVVTQVDCVVSTASWSGLPRPPQRGHVPREAPPPALCRPVNWGVLITLSGSARVWPRRESNSPPLPVT